MPASAVNGQSDHVIQSASYFHFSGKSMIRRAGVAMMAENPGDETGLRHEPSQRAGGIVNIAGAQDDRRLVEAALGNREAYAFIVRYYQPVLMRYVRRLLGRLAGSAEDVLQDVFIKAYVNLNDYDRSRPFAPWLYRIAHNETVSFLRKKNAEPQTIDGEDAQLILERLSDGENPDKVLNRSVEANAVRTALASLDRRYRDVLVLRYLEEKSYDDIADILALPPGTVATLIRRGLAQLKIPLQKSWGGRP
jgi:RNA polymerase sigma-70 factor, ECF subfamily